MLPGSEWSRHRYLCRVSQSDLAVVISIVAAAISFLAAVIAVVVGQTLSQRFQRNADERRWQREDALRRRTRSEEMAREAIERLTDAAVHVGWAAGYARGEAAGQGRTYVAPGVNDVVELTRPVRRAALEIEEEAIRAHLEKACALLVNGNAAQGFGADHPARGAWAVERTSEEIISAYLRGVPLPTPASSSQPEQWKVFSAAYSAVEDLWGFYEKEAESNEGHA